MNATITNEGLLIPKEWLHHFGDLKIHRDDQACVGCVPRTILVVVGPTSVD
jgi:hypothetical protein